MRAFVFPGQGSQSVGMAKAACERFPIARATFAEADQVLGFSLTALCFNGPEAELQQTTNSQPAILTASVALLRALTEAMGSAPDIVAGHSLGEYTALVCAGALSFADAARLVRARGQFMQEAVPSGVGSMAAIGAKAADVDALCRDVAQSQVLSPANYNSPNQVVIAGHAEAVARALQLAKERKLPGKELRVSAPFHCSLMQPAADRLRTMLATIRFADAAMPVLSNVDAKPYQKASEIADRLTRQVTSPVQWEASVNALRESGVDEVVEIGPGKVLSTLIRRMAPHIRVSSCEGPDDIVAVAAQTRSAQREPEMRPALKEWSEMNKEERQAAIAELLDFEVVRKRLDAKPHDIYRWMMVFKMPSWLVDGELRFHPLQLEQWLQSVGGIDAVKTQEAKQNAAKAE